MPLEAVKPLDTRAYFRPVSSSLVTLLRGLSARSWHRPTMAGSWLVRDVVAHLLDTTLRRLSFHRDGMAPPAPPRSVASDRDFVAFINDLNAQWVGSARRLSPKVLTGLYASASAEAADWFEALPLEAPALFPVSWAGEAASEGWFDIGREFTELWHHQQQIRIAVGAEALPDPRYLGAVIDVAMRGLPWAFRELRPDPGQHVAIDISGPSGGRWTMAYDGSEWILLAGHPPSAKARIGLTDDIAWKLLFNGLKSADAAGAVQVDGPAEYARALLRARSVVV